MDSKNIKEIAKEVAFLEQEIQKNPLGKNAQLAMSRIEIIMESLSLKESLELNDAVIKILKNN